MDNQRVLVVGGSRHLGAEIARRAASVGAHVIVGGRDLVAAEEVAAETGGEALRIDLQDEASIAAVAADIGTLDHVVSTAAAHHDVPVTDLDRDAVVAALTAKVIGPLLLAKHLAPYLRPTGSLLLFSGVVGWRPARGSVVKGVTNGAVEYAVRHLAAELAPIRVNAISPGIVDSGVWDGLGDERRHALLTKAAGTALVGRAGERSDIADAALWLLGAGYVSGEVIHVEGGARHRVG